jgi:phage baseplate assembly protein V
MKFAIERMWLRILHIVAPARIEMIDDRGAVQLLQVHLSSLQTNDSVPRLAEYGFTSNPPKGTDCTVLFLGGDQSKGIVIATNNQTYRMKALDAGDVALSDDKGQVVLLTSSGIHIKSPHLVRIEAPDLHCTGNITADGEIADQGGAKTMSAMRSTFNGHHHGTSPIPDEAM